MAVIEERLNENGEKSYRVKIRLRGCKPVSSTFKRKTDAKIWASKTESEIREGRYFKTVESQKHTLADLIDRYIKDELPKRLKDVNKVRMHLNWWKEEIGCLVLAEITPAVLAEKRDKLSKMPNERNKGYVELDEAKTKAPATVIRYMASMSHALSIACKEWLWIDENPMLKVRKPKLKNGRVRFLSDKERAALLKECKRSFNPYLYTVVVLALSTGSRFNEIMSLKWSDVDMERGLLMFKDTKNGDNRTVPLVGFAHQHLKQFSKVSPLDIGLLFPRSDGLQPMEIRKPWNKAVKDAGIIDFKFHDLRHSTASYLAMNGASIVELADVLGHKTLQMVKRYSHLSEQHTRTVMSRMNDNIFG